MGEEEKKVFEITLEPRLLNVRMEPNPILPEIHLFEDTSSMSYLDNTTIIIPQKQHSDIKREL